MSLVAKANDPAVTIRFPRAVAGGLLRELDQAAAQAGRSRNSEIVHRLAESLRLEKTQSAAQAG